MSTKPRLSTAVLMSLSLTISATAVVVSSIAIILALT